MKVSKFLKIFILTALSFITLSLKAGTIYVYNWTEYIPESVIKQFTDETGIKVVYTTFEGNEEMYAKLKLMNKDSSANSYDLIFPSSFYTEKLSKEGFLQPLDKSKIKNFDLIDTKYTNLPYDPNSTFSLPYNVGTTGILVNTDNISDNIDSWNDLWNPKFKNKVLLLNDVRDVFHFSFLVNQLSPNSTKEEDIKTAYNKLSLLLPNVVAFNSDAPENPFLQGEADIGIIWNYAAYKASQENPALKFITPKEGLLLWIDTVAMPKTAKNPEDAYKFLDFIFRPDIAKEIMIKNGVSMPVPKAIETLPDQLKNSTILFPSTEDFNKGVLQSDIGDAVTIYNKYWDLLKVGK